MTGPIDVVGELLNMTFFHYIEAAFNNRKLESIFNTLYVSDILDILIEWIERILKIRSINSSLGESSIRNTVSRGTPHREVFFTHALASGDK